MHRRTVSFAVKNTGKRAGTEIAEVYATLPEAAGEPFKRLVGWQRIELAPGESKTVTVAVDPRVMSVFDEQNKCLESIAGCLQDLCRSIFERDSFERDAPSPIALFEPCQCSGRFGHKGIR
jgi:beta-glucosidase